MFFGSNQIDSQLVGTKENSGKIWNQALWARVDRRHTISYTVVVTTGTLANDEKRERREEQYDHTQLHGPCWGPRSRFAYQGVVSRASQDLPTKRRVNDSILQSKGLPPEVLCPMGGREQKRVSPSLVGVCSQGGKKRGRKVSL